MLTVLIGLVTTLIAAEEGFAQNLVANGDLETGDFTAWNHSGIVDITRGDNIKTGKIPSKDSPTGF